MKTARQGDLFSANPRRRYPDAPGHRGRATSMAAAESIEPHVGRMHQRIINYLGQREEPGAIFTEIAADCDMLTQTVCGRLREMVLMRPPLIRDTGETRATPSNRQATIYDLTPAGQKLVAKRESASA